MKKIFFLLSLGVIASFMSSAAFAGPVISGGGTGDTQQYASCTNDELSFVIRGTAVVNFKQGLLIAGDGSKAFFKCDLKNTNLVPNTPSAGNLVWSCEQYPANDGIYQIQVQSSGVTGLTSAYLVQKQVYPLKPKYIATMNCH
ncbi:hypothetical protein [Bdellovibrio sp. HCB2-146]|uniref:hypothetical protein n=1 Tax=Bdellovibrio sp. HCB2-146 TaxID=3394362 RepID=UPI0039BC3491